MLHSGHESGTVVAGSIMVDNDYATGPSACLSRVGGTKTHEGARRSQISVQRTCWTMSTQSLLFRAAEGQQLQIESNSVKCVFLCSR